MGLAVALMLKLGLWQMDRLAWKTGLIAQIDAQMQVDPWSRRLGMADFIDGDEGLLFARGYVEGRFGPQSYSVGPYVVDGVLGYWIVTSLKLEGAHEDAVVLAVRGWAPDTLARAIIDERLPDIKIRAAGIARDPDKTGPANNPALGIWHRVDTQAMDPHAATRIFFIEQTTPADNPELKPVPVAVNLRNEHKNYAIFWFSMAGVFACLWVAFILRGRRSASSQGPSAP